jgi:hypothetical protein
MPDAPGELRCQSSGKIQGHGSGLTAFYRIEEAEHKREHYSPTIYEDPVSWIDLHQ